MSDIENKEVQKPKQFLIMVDELYMALLSKLVPGIQFCQVEALTVKDSDEYTLLANPNPKPKSESECCSVSCNEEG